MSSPDSQLTKLVESLTTSGSTEIRAENREWKELKRLCRASEANVERAFRSLVQQMRKNHAQIRLTALLAVNELFGRSHRFRRLTIDSMSELFELTLGASGHKLPKPNGSARRLRAKAVQFVDGWSRKFGDGYPALRSALEFVKSQKLDAVDDDGDRRNGNESQRRESESEANRNMVRARIESAIGELDDVERDVKSLLTQINACFELLIPKMSENEGQSGDDSSLERVRHVRDYTLDVIIAPIIEIPENADTSAVIDNMRDLHFQLASISAVKLKRLLQVMSKSSDMCETHLKRTIDLKCDIECVKQKFLELKIVSSEQMDAIESSAATVSARNSDSSDDEFEEVPEKEGLELIIPEHRRKEYGLEPLRMPSTSSDSRNRTLVNESAIQCKAPLPSGKLCPRRDQIKCPFHGPIVPRGESGVPLDEEDRKRDESRMANAVPEWQNPKLLRELKSSTGIDLTIGKRKRKKYPGLVSIKELENTPRKRLTRKVLSRASIERLDSDFHTDHERRSQQFSSQWNYSFQC